MLGSDSSLKLDSSLDSCVAPGGGHPGTLITIHWERAKYWHNECAERYAVWKEVYNIKRVETGFTSPGLTKRAVPAPAQSAGSTSTGIQLGWTISYTTTSHSSHNSVFWFEYLDNCIVKYIIMVGWLIQYLLPSFITLWKSNSYAFTVCSSSICNYQEVLANSCLCLWNVLMVYLLSVMVGELWKMDL